MGNVSREELLFTQVIIRSNLITLEQYQEILGIRADIQEKLGIRKPVDEIIIEQGFLSEKVVKNIRQKICYPASAIRPTVSSSMPVSQAGTPAAGVSQTGTSEASVPESVPQQSSFGEDILDNPPAPPEYRLVEKLGEGAMGAVFKAFHPQYQEVAIKFLDPRYNDDEEFVHRFLREAKTVKQLQHPHIVRALEYGEEKGIYYFVMEYARGQSLAKMVKGGRLKEERAVNIILQIAGALQYAHKNGFIHRDIKPENIIVDVEDHARLCDFGLIRRNERETLITRVGAFVGTPQYVSPEQARGLEDIDGRADMYSLGCTFYHIVTGKPPYAHTNPIVVLTWQATKPFPDPLEAAPDLSPRVAAVIRQMTAKDREIRLAGMDLLLQKLTEREEELDVSPEAALKKLSKTQKRTSTEVPEAEKIAAKRAARRKLRESGARAFRETRFRDSGTRKLRDTGAIEKKKQAEKRKMLWGFILWLTVSIVVAIVLIWQFFKL